jgi:DNA ligase 1
MIDTTNLQPSLAKNFEDRKLHFPVILQPKYDGVRALAYVDCDAQTVEWKFRSGKPIYSLDSQAKEILTRMNLPSTGMFMLDGEMVNPEGFSKCSGDIRRKSKQAPHLQYHIFDVVEIEHGTLGMPPEFCKDSWQERSNFLMLLFGGAHDIDSLHLVPYTRCLKASEIALANEKYETFGNSEGSVVKHLNSPYRQGRTFTWMKIKEERSVDFPVIEAYEGTGKYTGMLGGFKVQNPDTQVITNVGGGYSDAERKEFWDNRDSYYGRTMEVKYQYETSKGSLRHPTFKIFRIDK